MLTIRIVRIGFLPKNFDEKIILNHCSEVFRLHAGIETYHIREKSDLPGWAYSDNLLERAVPNRGHEDLLLALTNVSLEEDYYARRLENNRAIFTFHEIKDYLDSHDIPLENFVFRMLYEYTLLHLRFQGRIPVIAELTNFTHDETRACLFDMNGRKTDIYTSCENPIICYECEKKLKDEKVPNEVIDKIRNELGKVRKRIFYIVSDYIKAHPFIALAISSLSAIGLGIVGSFLYDVIRSYFSH